MICKFTERTKLSMKKLRTLHLQFDLPLYNSQASVFRGAIAEKAGKQNHLFHNHREGKGSQSYYHRYPLIQYKSIGGKAGIVCLEEGTDAIQEFLGQSDWSLNMGGVTIPLKIESLKVNQFTLNVWERRFNYNLYNWLPLNSENFEEYLRSPSLIKRVQLLEKILVAHILSFAAGVGWTIQKNIELSIIDIQREKTLSYKGVKFKSFDLAFSSNVSLPYHIGLGKSSSVGFGKVGRIYKEKEPVESIKEEETLLKIIFNKQSF